MTRESEIERLRAQVDTLTRERDALTESIQALGRGTENIIGEFDLMRQRAESAEAERDAAIAERNDWRESSMRHKRWAEQAEARAESAELAAKLDQGKLNGTLGFMDDHEVCDEQLRSALARAESGEARITELVEWAQGQLAEYEGDPSDEDDYIGGVMDGVQRTCRELIARAALEPVGEPQPQVFGVPRNADADAELTERLDAIKDAERRVGEPQRDACANPECVGGWVPDPDDDIGCVVCGEVHCRVPCPSCAPEPESETP